MPSKNSIDVKEEYRLVREKRISFEGPAPPKEWPSLYRHLFQPIRDINRVRYDEYKKDQNVEKERRRKFKKRVANLREEAYKMLDNINTKETKWRDLEPIVFGRFGKRVIW